jgi:hypothetical protein
MALTPEQQSQVDTTLAIEADRHAKQMELHTKMAKMEAVRIAQNTIIENRRNQPVEAREVTAADITAFADTLVAYINK